MVLDLGRYPEKIDFLAIVSLGFFLLLVGMIFASTPDLPKKIYDFGRDFTLQQVYPGVSFFAPSSVYNHMTVYNAAFQFCIGFAVFQVAILAARFAINDSIGRKAGTFSGLFFWFGAAAALWALMVGSIDWFMFLGWLVVLIGVVIAVRCAIAFVFYGKY
jgi:hypothetical protein